MKTVPLLLLLCASLHACAAQPSPYVTTCNDPSCSEIAAPVESQYKAQDGILVITAPSIMISVPGSASKIAAQGDVTAIFFEDGQSIGATTLSPVDIGFEGEEVPMGDFMNMVFLEPYSAIRDKGIDRAALHALRSFKLAVFDGAEAHYFQRNGLTVFYSLTADGEQYKIYIVDEAHDNVVTLIDLIGFTHRQAKELLSSIQQHKI